MWPWVKSAAFTLNISVCEYVFVCVCLSMSVGWCVFFSVCGFLCMFVCDCVSNSDLLDILQVK